MRLTGAQALIKSLEMLGVEVMFGLPGGAILPVYDPIIESSIRHVLVRHEQGAGHMAEGYADATGRPGVAMVTSGPGATNIVTPLMDAMMDSVPLVVITGQVNSESIGTDAFQECDITGITMGVTKHNWLVTDVDDIPRVLCEAFWVATTGRPGPVLIDFPKDIATATMEWWWPEEIDLPGYKVPGRGAPEAVNQAVELLLESKRPVLYAGGGLVSAGAGEALERLVGMTGLPVVTTLMARGIISDDHPLCLGMPGMHGNYTAVMALQRADLLVALGSRFDDRVTGKIDAFAPDAKVIHVDIDPAEINKVRHADVGIVGDCRAVVEDLCSALMRRGFESPSEGRGVDYDLDTGGEAGVEGDIIVLEQSRLLSRWRGDVGKWVKLLKEWQVTYPLNYDQQVDGPLKPQYVVERLSALAPRDTICVAGVGQHQMWASQWWKFSEPRHWINSGGAGTMGFCVPAAIGAKVGRPEAVVWGIDGDGCFQMTAQELVTAASEGIPVKIAILNNAYLGMVRQWQELFYEERYSEVYLSPDLPDYAKWAEAMGCVGVSVERACDVDEAIIAANAIDDRPVVIDFRTDVFEKVYPMVPAGHSNDDIILGPVVSDVAQSGVA
jgi:acetolactate synthase-1/2/3 large subunit